MSSSVVGSYRRTLITYFLLALILLFSFSSLRGDAHTAIQPFFEWMETTWFGVAGKTWGAVFAIVEAVHLLALALLGGAVIAGDGRLLGIILTDVPAQVVVEKTHKILVWALVIIIATGIFCACGVAMKIYYMPVYWYKMLALMVGLFFVFFIKKPLLSRNLDDIDPLVLKLVAISSMMVWFTVAATGRWIGFSG